MECRDNIDFPRVELAPGHEVTYSFDNAGRFEVTSKENGFMKCVLDLPEDEIEVTRPHLAEKTNHNYVEVKPNSTIRLCNSPSLVNTIDCGHSDYDDASGVVTPSRDGSSRGGDEGNGDYESDDFHAHDLDEDEDEVMGDNIAHAVLSSSGAAASRGKGSQQEVFSPSRGVLSGERRSAQEQYPFPTLPSASPVSPMSPEDGDSSSAFDETDGATSFNSPIFFGRSISKFSSESVPAGQAGPSGQARQPRGAYAGYDEAVTFCDDDDEGLADEEELDGIHAQRLKLKNMSKATQQRLGGTRLEGRGVPVGSVWGSADTEDAPVASAAVPDEKYVPESVANHGRKAIGKTAEMTRGAIAGRVSTKPPSMYNVVPIRFRQRRFVVISDYDFQFKQISHFVNAPLEFRLHADVPLHVEHELVGVSSNPNLCFESPLLQQMQTGAYQFIPPCAGEIHVSCKVYTDMQCVIQVYDPKDINSIASIASNSEAARSAVSGAGSGSKGGAKGKTAATSSIVWVCGCEAVSGPACSRQLGWQGHESPISFPSWQQHASLHPAAPTRQCRSFSRQRRTGSKGGISGHRGEAVCTSSGFQQLL